MVKYRCRVLRDGQLHSLVQLCSQHCSGTVRSSMQRSSTVYSAVQDNVTVQYNCSIQLVNFYSVIQMFSTRRFYIYAQLYVLYMKTVLYNCMYCIWQLYCATRLSSTRKCDISLKHIMYTIIVIAIKLSSSTSVRWRYLRLSRTARQGPSHTASLSNVLSLALVNTTWQTNCV